LADRIQEGKSLENALRRFKRKVQQEDIIKEVKRHSFYLKPGEKSASRKHWRASAAGKKHAKNKTEYCWATPSPSGPFHSTRVFRVK
jgi:small subunit ribosomal protein S21